MADLQALLWPGSERDVVPAHQLQIHASNGGQVLGAEEAGQLIGFSYAFPARRSELGWFLYSHLAGVHPEFQGRGLGRALKQAQHQFAAEQGYPVVVWTFDPLKAGNAVFNLERLGALGRRYLPDYYGPLNDTVNVGRPSDRLEVHWPIAGSERATADPILIPRSLPLEELRSAFQQAFAADFAAVGFDAGADSYRLARI